MPPLILGRTTPTTTVALIAQIQALQRRVLSREVEADGPEVDADLALWVEIHDATGTTTEARTDVLSALLRDLDFLLT